MSNYQNLPTNSSPNALASSPPLSPVSPHEMSTSQHNSASPTPFPDPEVSDSINHDSLISSNDNILTRFYKSKIQPNLGITYSLASQLFNSLMILFCKLLVTPPESQPEKQPLHPFQIMFVRMLITYLGCIYYFVRVSPNPDFPFGPKGYRLMMILRGIGGYVSVGGQYMSLMYLDISDTITITFLSPTVTSILASFTLGQVLTKIELGFGGLAFIGVLLIAKPQFLFGGGDEEESALARFIGCCFAFFSTFGTAVAMCSIKKIGFHAHPLLTVSFYALVSCLMSAVLGTIFVPDFYRLPDNFRDWVLILLIGIAGFMKQYLQTTGIQREKKTSRAVAMTYSQLIYASFFDWIFFNHIPGGLELIGECVVVFAVMSIVYFKSADSGDETVPPTSSDANRSKGTEEENEFNIDLEDFNDDDLNESNHINSTDSHS
ncbi:unnamed protein product [Ambrosiozyma monospora]|uniref:Unnamed protein product n=1 Tax=Ambrosiozyma monospora TaxID=43982 RepID=A0ACB5SR66_AMBMO|nr:unnamed protein product [Ambrosiozyma monospora]